ncbi:oxidoreductase [Herbaspirillum huttiense]|uniref:Oxidoreductase n=2 Tax=Herbaspirillum huttiense TaxID=863372 RepID=A0AAJ2LUJ1_9BURK|nr:oxidoreductase [Herbaspirillum huttiense]MDR9839464.1 oxidoreductase [Herbaspirillum huttiense]
MNQFGYKGQQGPNSSAGDFNLQQFMIRQVLGEASTSTVVKVVAVTNAGGLEPVGFVDVVPLVAQVDGYGNATPHGTIFGLPYSRLQGGDDAVILDPKVGDLGIAIFADRDISSVKATKAAANPGSKRRFDMADGMYLGGLLNGTPVQYVQFTAGGINVVSPQKITLSAPQVEIDASTSLTVNSPQSNFSGMVIIQGLLSFLAGITGSGGGATTGTITGVMRFIGSVFANGKHIDDTHTHTSTNPGNPTSSVN